LHRREAMVVATRQLLTGFPIRISFCLPAALRFSRVVLLKTVSSSRQEDLERVITPAEGPSMPDIGADRCLI